MRNSGILDALVSRNKQQILAAAVLQPERSWYLSELAAQLKVQPSSIQRELRLLVDAGILTRRENGNRVYFQADRNCPVFSELQRLLLKTVGLVDVLGQALAPVRNRIKLAIIYGSIATSEEHSRSDVDLMVIGTIRLSDIALALRDVPSRLGRSVNPMVYTCEEFTTKLKEGNHFLRTVLSEEMLFVYGSEDDLAKLTERPARENASDQQSRDSRPPRHR